ncbi:MAG: hypothetical protein H0W90_12585 [Actinobacteria bacterium]|nr:hypothetical protein [Actinomycetota bacterium]
MTLEANDIFSRIWAVYDAGNLLTTCAWCGRVQLDGEWLVPPRAALDAIDEQNVLSHSICDGCAAHQSTADAAGVATTKS